MIPVLLASAAAAIGIGYMSVIAEASVRKVHELTTVRKTVEAIFFFPVIDSISRWTDASRLVLRWSQIVQWLVIVLVVAAGAGAIAVWLYVWAFASVIKWLSLIVVAAVGVGWLWLAFWRS